jgi:hypothetical protein
MASDPWGYWSAERIAVASGCPRAAVQTHWPLIAHELALCGIATPNVAIGVIGTTAIEGGSTFTPVREGCYLGEPEPAESHRQTLPYYPFYGRGHIQLTHRSNYEKYGRLVGALWGVPPPPLMDEPDLALDPSIAAAVIALWFRETRALPSASYPQGYSLREACEMRDWEWVRRLVYGGSDAAGAQRIAQIEADLGPPGGLTVSDLPVYTSSYPAIAQNDSWSCAPTSMRWALSAWGRSPAESWVENSMIAENVVSTNQGLLDAAGFGLARWLDRHYAEFGFDGDNDGNVSFDDVAAEAITLKHPLLLGGRGWYHWTGCRGFDGTRLLLANPAPGWKGVGQTLTREQFEYLGPFSLVRVLHPAAEAEVPIPPTEPDDPLAPWAGQVGSGLLEMMTADATLPAQRRSTWLPLGTPAPSDVEECLGQNMVMYRWALTVGRGARYRSDG